MFMVSVGRRERNDPFAVSQTSECGHPRPPSSLRRIGWIILLRGRTTGSDPGQRWQVEHPGGVVRRLVLLLVRPEADGVPIGRAVLVAAVSGH